MMFVFQFNLSPNDAMAGKSPSGRRTSPGKRTTSQSPPRRTPNKDGSPSRSVNDMLNLDYLSEH